jgi:hypothetical protein
LRVSVGFGGRRIPISLYIMQDKYIWKAIETSNLLPPLSTLSSQRGVVIQRPFISESQNLIGGSAWIVGSILVVCLIHLLWTTYRQRKGSLISSKVSEEISKKRPEYGGYSISEWFGDCLLPTWQSIVTILGLYLILFFVSHYHKFTIWFAPLIYSQNNHYQNLIAIHAGIGTIIFALFIFIADRFGKDNDEGQLLLKQSFLFPLTLAEIVGFFVFIWGNINFWAILSVIGVAILTIVSLYRLLSLLLDPPDFSRKLSQLLRDKVKKGIDLAIKERLGNNFLINSLGEGKIELSYYPLSFDAEDKPDYHSFYTNKLGTIVDIRIDKLNEIAKLVESEANKNGYSFYSDKKKEIPEAHIDGNTSEAGRTKFNLVNSQYLTKKLGDEIDEKNSILLAIDKRAVQDKEIIKTLNDLVQSAFIIKKKNNYSENISAEISELRDQFGEAIEEKKLGRIKTLEKIYREIAEAFLEAISPFGAYSYEEARKESRSLFGGWNEIRWLSDSVRSLIYKASQTHDQEVIRELAYLPVSIAIRAIQAGDQYLFQEFIRYPNLLYQLALEEDNERIRDFMIDRSWRHLKEMSDFYIEHQLTRKIADIDSLKKYKEYTIPIFFAFQNLLKTAFEKRDTKSFQEFLDQFTSLYRRLDSENTYTRAEHLRFNLERITDPEQKKALEEKIKIQEEKENASKDIKEMKQQVIFGLSAWIFEKYRNHTTSPSLSSLYEIIFPKLPSTLPALTEIYSSSRSFETKSFWDWDGWEMIADGEVHMIDFNSKLDRLYLFKTLSLLSGMSPDAIEAITLPPSRELASLVEDSSGTLIYMLDELANNPTRWGIPLPDGAVEKIEPFKEILRKAKVAQEKKEEERVEAEEIHPDKLKEFKSEIREHFYGSAIIRPVMKKVGSFVDLISRPIPESVPSYGYNQIDRKEAFIKDWYIHYVGFGENYGRGMASSENQLIFSQMLESCPDKKDIRKENVVKEIKNAITDKSLANPIVFLNSNYFFEYEDLRINDDFIPYYITENQDERFVGQHGYMGVLKIGTRKVPVINVYARGTSLDDKILVADLNEFGDLVQYSPRQTSIPDEPLDDIFLIRVSDLNKDTERRNKILSDDPIWLQQHEDKEAYLRRQVLINFYERMEFRVKNEAKGRALNIC